MGVHFGCGRKS